MRLRRRTVKPKPLGLLQSDKVNINFRPPAKGPRSSDIDMGKPKPSATASHSEPLSQNANNVPSMETQCIESDEILLFKPVPNKNKRQNNLYTADKPGNKMPRVEVHNRFDPLTGLPADGGNNSVQPDAQAPTTKRRPAPIILDGKPKDSFKNLRKLLSEMCRQKFLIKFGPTTTAIRLETVEGKALVREALTQRNMNFWSYTNKEDRSHAFVLHGLDCDIELAEIETDIRRQLPELVKIYKMNTKYRKLYLVITSNKIKLQDIQQKIRSVCYCKVTFQRHVNKKEIIQCHRCQKLVS